jgi:hypothetical protein
MDQLPAMNRQPFTRSAMIAALKDKRRERVQFRFAPMMPILIIFSIGCWICIALIVRHYLLPTP